MASIPSTRPTMPTSAGETPPQPEGARRDLFACLLSLTPFATPGTDSAITGDISADDASAPDGTPQGETTADENSPDDLALPAIPTDFIPLLAAQAAAPVVANAVPGAAKTPQCKADQIVANAASGTHILVPTVDMVAGTAAGPQTNQIVIPTEVPASPAQAIPHAAIVASMVNTEAAREPKAEAPLTEKETFELAKAGNAVTLNISSVAIANRSATPPVTGSVPTHAAADVAPVVPTLAAQAEAHGQTDRADQPALPAQVALAAAPLPDASPLVASLAPASETMTTAPADIARPTEPGNPAVERHLDLVRDSEWLDQLARDIVRSGDGDAPMRFKLHPQTLGHLKVELTQSDQGTSVRFTTETEVARTIIADAQPRLAAEARAHGLRIAETHVDLAGSGHDQTRDPRRQEDVRAGTPLRTAGQGAEENETPRDQQRGTERFA